MRSSVARRLGFDIGGLVPSDRNVDGVVEMVLDATGNCAHPLTAARARPVRCRVMPQTQDDPANRERPKLPDDT